MISVKHETGLTLGGPAALSPPTPPHPISEVTRIYDRGAKKCNLSLNITVISKMVLCFLHKKFQLVCDSLWNGRSLDIFISSLKSQAMHSYILQQSLSVSN